MPVLPQRRAEVPYRRLLSSAWPVDRLAAVLVDRADWRPFPSLGDRDGWQRLAPGIRERLSEAGRKSLGGPWPALPASLFLEFARSGNRSRYEAARSARRERLRELVLAECVQNEGRYLDEIVTGAWLTCEETWWGVPAHMGMQKRGRGLPDVTEPVIDLFAAETASLLAWTEYLLGDRLDQISPLVRERIRLEIERRILEPFRRREDFSWMGLTPGAGAVNNWNPWINSNCLACALLLEPRDRRAGTVFKVLRSLDRFLDGYHEDGGCDEGPGYWGRAGASLFDNLEVLHSATAGKVDFYAMPLVREIGRYIYRVQIADDWFVNFADASARVRLSAGLVYRYGKAIGDTRMQGLGAWADRRPDADAARPDSIGRQLAALFGAAELKAAQPFQPLVREAWFPGIQVMTARLKEGSAEGLYLAAQGGHNAESHNHNDVGNFIVFAGGKPALIDVGVETYTAKTFSPQRYEIWTMQSAYHNLPTIGGVMQAAGREYAARDVRFEAQPGGVAFSLDIAGAYPAEAGVESWNRTFRLDRSRNAIELRERFRLRKPTGSISLTLMTPGPVKEPGPGRLAVAGVMVQFDAAALKHAVEEVAVTDGRLRSAWGDRLYRVLLQSRLEAREGDWTILITQG